MQVATRPATYRPFTIEKTLENAKIIENQNNFAWYLKLVKKNHEKMGHFKDVEKQCALRRTPSVEHDLVLNILKMTPTFVGRWEC